MGNHSGSSKYTLTKFYNFGWMRTRESGNKISLKEHFRHWLNSLHLTK